MTIHFTKMHGIGNDFVVIDAINQSFMPQTDTIRRITDRHFGVGCDQLLLVESSSTADVDFRYRIFNADGSEVEQCGNGARCFARFVYDHQLTKKRQIRVKTASGIITLFIEDDGQVRVNMGIPDFTPASLPFNVSTLQSRYSLSSSGGDIEFGAVSMGNPHISIMVDDVNRAPVATLGPELETHSLFPQRVNVGFFQILSSQRIKLRVFERGTGETLACGTGACAAVAIAHQWQLVQECVEVSLPGGLLTIFWQGAGSTLWMTGPAESVFEGELFL